MGVFRYEAVDTAGKKIIGSMQAESESHVQERLQGMGLKPTVIVQPTPTVRQRPGRAASTKIHLNARSRNLFHRSLATTLKSGMPVGQALGVLADHSYDPTAKTVALDLKRVVDAGGSLSEGMARYPGVFEEWQIGTYQAAELGGFLAETSETIASQYEKKKPGCFNIACSALWFNLIGVLFLVIISSPMISIFCGSFMKGNSNVLGSYFLALKNYLLLRGFLVVSPLIILKIFGKVSAEKRWYQSISHKMPLAGTRFRARTMAVFCRTIERLLQAGVSPIQAWEAAARGARSPFYKDSLSLGIQVLRDDGDIPKAFKATGLIDPEMMSYMETAAKSGSIGDALSYAAKNFEFTETEMAGRLNGMRLQSLILACLLLGGILLVAWIGSYVNGAFDIYDSLLRKGL